MRKSFTALGMVLLLVAAAGCAREEAQMTDTAPVADTAVVDTAVSRTTAIVWIDDPTLGSAVTADGRIPLGQTDNDFNPGDTIYYAMEIGDAPAGANVMVQWFAPGNNKVHEETKTVTAGQGYLAFQAPDTSSWAVGDYRAEIYANGTLAHSEDFNIEAP